ncbi:cell wall-binding repeat-containing protein [Peptostreptococcus faecalis]|uniref:cell wall-binding repeat-containing protein n=1 Tax=Peptostreptococcus faecalis TaxID=2045015 RepID=UPI000C7C6199|nr:cell wall-binding repeat-containing protein [Peptostreptococcus faecalis]
MKKIISLCLGAMIFATSISISSASDLNVTRIAGGDRYETAVLANKKYMNKADGNLAVIASGQDFKTALYGSYMASALKVPFYVLPKNDGVSKAVLSELDSLSIKRVYVMGDKGVLSAKVDNTLKARGIGVERIHDKVDNYKNKVYICDYVDGILFNAFFPNDIARGDNIGILINDNKFPDLLSSVSFSSDLMRTHGYGVFSSNVLSERQEGLEYFSPQAYIIGGYDSVSNKFTTEQPLGDGTYRGDNRIYGSDRYKTAVEIAKAYKPVLNKDIKTIVLVNGKDYPDALSSSLVATMNNGAVLLTQPEKLNADTREYIKNNDIRNVIIVGGTNSVSKTVENELRNLK